MKYNNIVMSSLLALVFAGTAFAANPYAGKFYATGDPKKAEFALTFDDGPGYITEDLLKLLAQHNAKATFFMLGTSARAYPQKVAAVAAAGHLIGNHTDTHMNWFKAGKAPNAARTLETELQRAGDSIEKASGQRPWVMRLPNGYSKPWAKETAGRAGYTVINWTYGSDWTKTPEDKMTAEYLKALKPGAVFLLHDGGGKTREKSLRIVGKILEAAEKKGLKPVRVDELFGLQQAAGGAKK